MIWISILFCLAPTLFFALDQTGTLPATRDPMTFSVLFGAIGVVGLAFARRGSLKKMVYAAIFGALLVIAQIAVIVAYVFATADFS